MGQKFLIPVTLPSWLYYSMRRLKRLVIPPAQPSIGINIWGERYVEWSFLSSHIPSGPGEAIEFGCEQGYMSLLAAQRGFHVIANDLEQQSFLWQHPRVDFRQGDFLKLDLPPNHFDLAINCSSVEHVGVAGRYGIQTNEDEGDIQVMKKLAEILKPAGLLLMTAPCGKDTVMAPWCRVYGSQRFPRLLAPFAVEKESYWVKDARNRWMSSARETALDFQPIYNSSDAHSCAYALACFVLRKL